MGKRGVQDRDRGARRLRAVLRELARGTRVSVGVHEDTGAARHPKSTASVATVAAITELGSTTRRPFGWLRSTIDTIRPQIERRLANAARRAVARALKSDAPEAELDAAFEKVATQVANQVKRTVRRLDLVETRTLLHSIEGRVVRGVGG